MSRYRVSMPARDDIREIIRHVGTEHPQAAINLRHKLYAAFERLANQPGIDQVRADLPSRTGLRFWRVDRYLIVYRNHPVEGVGIARVLHGSRDIAGLLRDEPLEDE